MYKIYLSLLLTLSIFVSNHSYSQGYSFEHLTYDGVLDNESILTIANDSKGQLWFGGEYNLFKYNSEKIKDVALSPSFQNLGRYITQIYIDEIDNIHIGTDEGLIVYNIEKDSILIDKTKSPIKNSITAIKKFGSNLLVASYEGLYSLKYDQKSNKYIVQKKLYDTKVTSITQGNQPIYFAAKNNIYFIKDNKSNPVKTITLPSNVREIKTIEIIKDQIWIGTRYNGLFIVNKDQTITNLKQSNSNLPSDDIRKIIHYGDKILVGGLKGLSIIDSKGKIENYYHNPKNLKSISQNSIYDIYIDKQHTIWVGTYYGGINAIYPNLKPINNISHQENTTYPIHSLIIKAIAENKSHIYIASDEKGVLAINKQTKSSEILPTTSLLVKDIIFHGDYLYITQTNGGIDRYNIKTNKIENTFYNKNIIKNKNIQFLASTSDHIFVTDRNHIYSIGASGTTNQYNELKERIIDELITDKNDVVYTISNASVWKKKPNEDRFKQILKSEYFSIELNEKNELYLSTENEIFVLKNNKVIPIYKSKSNNLGYFKVRNNKLWIGTNTGIIQYDLNTKQQILITKEDGLNTNSYQYSSFYINDDGVLYAFNSNGINYFDPNKLFINNTIPNVILQKFKVFDQELAIQNKGDYNQYQVELDHDQNFINIEFASSNLINPKKNTYKYKLEGFDKDWKTTNLPIAEYTNIPPGEYKLVIFTANNDQIWSTIPFEIHTIVHPPIWRTWWAYLTYIILFASITYLIIKTITERKVLINSEKEYQKKIKFFTQISHEIRTPLTLITVPIEDIVANSTDNPNVNQKAKKLQKNANKLLNIVNELLDFKKIDDGKSEIDLQPIDIKAYLEEYFYLFTDLALAKNLNFYIKTLEASSQVLIDTKHFDKVIYNLLSNAIKYSNEGGTVYLEAQTHNNNYQIQIVDNGIGISDNNQFKIFEEYYRDPKSQDIIGNGIGLALTKEIITLHKGNITCEIKNVNNENLTVFTVSLPLSTVKHQVVNPPIEESIVLENIIHFDNQRQETILIVEDNQELSETISNIFEGSYNILKAYNGAEALELATKNLPDIIISDLMMPKMNGFELTEQIKQNIVTAHIPVVMLTAVTTKESHITGLKYGANVYLEKPFNPSVLSYTIQNLLQIASKNRTEFNILNNNITNEIDLKLIEKIENILDKNLANNEFGVDEFSKELGVSQSVLYKKLKAITNLSINNYVKQYRFKKSLELLLSENNISEVAYAVGFSDRKYFSKEFKKQFGFTPTEYIEQKKSGQD